MVQATNTIDRVCLDRLAKATKIARVCRNERLNAHEARNLPEETRELIERAAMFPRPMRRPSSEITWEFVYALLDF